MSPEDHLYSSTRFQSVGALFLLIAKLGTAGLGLVVVVAANLLVKSFDAVPVTFAPYRSVAQSIR